MPTSAHSDPMAELKTVSGSRRLPRRVRRKTRGSTRESARADGQPLGPTQTTRPAPRCGAERAAIISRGSKNRLTVYPAVEPWPQPQPPHPPPRALPRRPPAASSRAPEASLSKTWNVASVMSEISSSWRVVFTGFKACFACRMVRPPSLIPENSTGSIAANCIGGAPRPADVSLRLAGPRPAFAGAQLALADLFCNR
jgi:hypothetical protein